MCSYTWLPLQIDNRADRKIQERFKSYILDFKKLKDAVARYDIETFDG